MYKKIFFLAVFSVVVFLVAGGADAQTLGISCTQTGGNAQIATAIAKVVSAKTDYQMRTEAHAGAQLYVPEVNAGRTQFGVANIYQITFAVTGTGLFEGHPNPNLRLVGTLMTFRTGLLVKDDSNIKTIADLKGKRVPSGLPSAPTGLLALRAFLATGGLTLKDVRQVPTISFGTMWDGFEAGKFDTTIAAPGTGRVQEMAAKLGKLRFLSINPSPEGYAKAKRIIPNSEPVLVKPGPGFVAIHKPTYVIGYNYTLFTNKNVPDKIVYEVTKAIYESQDELRNTGAVWQDFDVKTLGRKWANIHYHPGAIKLFKEKGLW